MSYSGPPGVNAPHPSLPPRPPPGATTSKPSKFSSTFGPSAPQPYPSSPAPGVYPSSTSYSSAPTYGTAAPPTHYGASQSASSYSYSQASVGGGRGGRGGYGGQGRGGYGNYNQQTPAGYGSAYGGAQAGAYSTPPQIRNPFPSPQEQQQQGGASGYDVDEAAQIAAWQSAYIPRDPSMDMDASGAVGGKTAGRPGAVGPTYPSAPPDAGVGTTTAVPAATGPAISHERKQTVYRQGGGKKWHDDTLLDWDPTHLRLFVGNLAGETTDDSLLKAFAGWKSVQKAKVIRDKRTTKSKGYGFVSFSDPDDFFQAAKEMNGKYIQSHPVTVKKANTEIRVTNVKDKGGKGKYQHKNKGGNGNGTGGGGGGYEPYLGATGAGVTKPGQKTKGGLKLLG